MVNTERMNASLNTVVSSLTMYGDDAITIREAKSTLYSNLVEFGLKSIMPGPYFASRCKRQTDRVQGDLDRSPVG
jgi:hypothetical protein